MVKHDGKEIERLMARRKLLHKITRLAREKSLVKRRDSISCKMFFHLCHQKKKSFNLAREKFNMVDLHDLQDRYKR